MHCDAVVLDVSLDVISHTSAQFSDTDHIWVCIFSSSCCFDVVQKLARELLWLSDQSSLNCRFVAFFNIMQTEAFFCSFRAYYSCRACPLCQYWITWSHTCSCKASCWQRAFVAKFLETFCSAHHVSTVGVFWIQWAVLQYNIYFSLLSQKFYWYIQLESSWLSWMYISTIPSTVRWKGARASSLRFYVK